MDIIITERPAQQWSDCLIQIYEAQYIHHDTVYDESIPGTCITAKYNIMTGFDKSSAWTCM